jgi:uncharacterized protein (DUF885 family)
LSANQKFEELRKEMLDKFLEENPTFASFLGLHDPYDHLLPRGGTDQILKNHRLLVEYATRMQTTIDYDSLDDANKVDWEVLKNAVEASKFEVYEQRSHELDPDASGLIGSAFFGMITRDYAPLERRIEAVISRLEKVPLYLQEFRSRFENTKPVKLWTEVAIESANQMPGLFHFVVAMAKDKVPEQLHQRLVKAVENFTKPFHEHIEWLQSLQSKTTEEWALGKEKFEKLLQLRGLEMTSDEILKLGVKYLNELKEARAKLSAQIAPDKDVKEVIETIEKNAPKTFEEALKATSDAMEEAKKFTIENNLATVYEEDKLLVGETPAFLAPLIPFAALFMPSRFDKPMIGNYIVTRPKDVANLGKHLNYASVRNTAVHEAFPGHFLQGTVSNRSSLVHLLAGGTETTEGWAHYCEQMMVEHGFVTSLESKLMQINDAIWRAVRIIVDVKLSRGEMSFDDAVEMLVTEVGMSKEGAVAEVRRYTMTPGYALSYLLGKHLILKLRDEIKAKMGEKFTERFFHDVITANGFLPVHLLRKVFDQKIQA